MANTPQAKKRIRRNDRRAEINGARVSRIRTFVKQVESAIESGDRSEAEAAIRKVQPELARGVAKGIVHRNTAARKISRLSRRISALGDAPAQPAKAAQPTKSAKPAQPGKLAKAAPPAKAPKPAKAPAKRAKATR